MQKSTEKLQNVSWATYPFSLFTDAVVEADSKYHVKTLNYAQGHIKSQWKSKEKLLTCKHSQEPWNSIKLCEEEKKK